MTEKILLGAVALHGARILLLIINLLRIAIPDYWSLITVLLMVAIAGYGWSSLPDGVSTLDYFRFNHRYRVILAGASIGLIVGAADLS